MPWTAPEVERSDEPLVADELTMLTGWLEWHRGTLLHKCAGLTGEQLAQWSVPPSNLSLLGLVRHMADVERAWFRSRFGGEDVPALFPGEDEVFEAADAAHAEEDFARFTAECAAARVAVEGAGLDETFEHHKHGTMSLRWVYVHMIEEYARHNGHADLLRERIDGVTGD
ncbi:MAG: DinB family protein [Actinocatenispora sp.]